MATTNFQTVDEYISSFSRDVQDVLEEIRQTIKEAASEAQEKISYDMPTFTLHGHYLTSFAAWKNHVGFYALPVAAFKDELSSYEQSKGTVKFPLDKPMPLTLIGKMVKYRAEENPESKRT